MSCNIKIPFWFEQCPDWWQNLVIKHKENWEGIINDAGGKIHRAPNRFSDNAISSIEFETEAHYTWFLLRWS